MHPTVVLLSVSVIALAMPSAIAKRIRHQRIEPCAGAFREISFCLAGLWDNRGYLIKLFSFLRIGKHARQNFYGGQDRLRNDFENGRQFSLYCSHRISDENDFEIIEMSWLPTIRIARGRKYTFRDTFQC